MSAISLFEEKQVRRAWNTSEQKWLFATIAGDPCQLLPRKLGQIVAGTSSPSPSRGHPVPVVSSCCSLIPSLRSAGLVIETQSDNKISTPENFQALSEAKKRITQKKS